MTSFVARSLNVPLPQDGVLALGPVVRAEHWVVLTTAQVVAERLQADAQASADQLLMDAAAERERLKQAARAEWDARFIKQAGALETAYQAWRKQWQDAMTSCLDQALQTALGRLALGVDVETRLRCVSTALAEVAGPVEGARLQLSPDDYEQAQDHDWPWPLEKHASLPPGQCCLQGQDGRWFMAWEQVIGRLTTPDEVVKDQANT